MKNLTSSLSSFVRSPVNSSLSESTFAKFNFVTSTKPQSAEVEVMLRSVFNPRSNAASWTSRTTATSGTAPEMAFRRVSRCVVLSVCAVDAFYVGVKFPISPLRLNRRQNKTQQIVTPKRKQVTFPPRTGSLT